MTELHLPWLQLCILLPLVGAIWVGRLRDSDRARRLSTVFHGLALVSAFGAWQDFFVVHSQQAHDAMDMVGGFGGRPLLVLDDLSAPLLPLAALVFLLTSVATVRAKIRRFSFAWALFSESIVLATFCCKEPWCLIALLALATVPPFMELRARGKQTRVYVLHMGLFVALMALGQWLVDSLGTKTQLPLWALLPMLLAICIRSGVAPFHCWMSDLFEHATFGTALLFVTPMTGAYAAMRLVLPIAPESVLHSLGWLSLATAVYAAGLALVQREARRFFCYLFLSHSSLVLVGLESESVIGLTGALCVWLSIGLSLTGFGLTLRAMEARTGRLTLVDFHGLYEHTPTLAAFYLLTGLASVGFPGTFGFIGTELLVDGAVQAYPYVGAAVVLAAAINGIAVVHSYFMLFTGTRHASAVSLHKRLRERLAVLTLAALILGGGLFPQPGVFSRHHAAHGLLQERERLALTEHGHMIREQKREDHQNEPVQPQAHPTPLDAADVAKNTPNPVPATVPPAVIAVPAAVTIGPVPASSSVAVPSASNPKSKSESVAPLSSTKTVENFPAPALPAKVKIDVRPGPETEG